MLQLKLRNIGVIFLNFQSCACCKNIWRIMNTIACIWRKTILRHFLGHYLSLEAHIFRSFASGDRCCPRQISERTLAPNENYCLYRNLSLIISSVRPCQMKSTAFAAQLSETPWPKLNAASVFFPDILV